MDVEVPRRLVVGMASWGKGTGWGASWGKGTGWVASWVTEMGAAGEAGWAGGKESIQVVERVAGREASWAVEKVAELATGQGSEKAAE